MEEGMLVSTDEGGDSDGDDVPGVVLSDHSYSGSPECLPRHATEPPVLCRASQERNVSSKPVEQSMEEDGLTCTICFEPWTNSSEHRLVSLRCGHLFGRSCITRWLKGQSSRCPQCNARARKSEIRNIYAKSIKMLDTTERDQAVAELQKEKDLRSKMELDFAKERLNHSMINIDYQRVKRELMEANKLLQDYRSGAKHIELSQSAKSNSLFNLEKDVLIHKKGECRIANMSEMLGLILVSQKSTNEMFTGYGFRKISACEMRTKEFVLVHQKPIKDMVFHRHDGLVLSASLDKSVKITSIVSNSVVQTYSLESDVWSCEWKNGEPGDQDKTYFYAGLRTGNVLLFDTRFTSKYVQELPKFGSNTPVASLQYLSKSGCSNPRKSGLLVGKLSDCNFVQEASDGGYRATPLPMFGPFISLSSEPSSGHFLISCRPTLKQPHVTHTLCELACNSENEELSCNPIQTVLGGRNQLQLTRSKLLPHPDDCSSLLICAGDEDSRGAVVWDGSSGNRIGCLKSESPVLDFVNMELNQKLHLAALTDTSLKVYSWNSS